MLRPIIRVNNALPLYANGFLTKNLKTNTFKDAAVSGESKPKFVNDSSHQGRSEHLKLSTIESVSYILAAFNSILSKCVVLFTKVSKDPLTFKALSIGRKNNKHF